MLTRERALSPALRRLVAELPITQAVQLAGNRADMVQPTSAVPAQVRGTGWVTPLRGLRLYWLW